MDKTINIIDYLIEFINKHLEFKHYHLFNYIELYDPEQEEGQKDFMKLTNEEYNTLVALGVIKNEDK